MTTFMHKGPTGNYCDCTDQCLASCDCENTTCHGREAMLNEFYGDVVEECIELGEGMKVGDHKNYPLGHFNMGYDKAISDYQSAMKKLIE